MPREKVDDKQKGKLKRMRRARGGRTLPRSGGGVHEDKKCKKVERELAAEAEAEMQNWKQQEEDADEIAHELLSERDILDADVWEEYKELKTMIDEAADDIEVAVGHPVMKKEEEDATAD